MVRPDRLPLVDMEGFTKDGDYATTIPLRGADGMQASILTLGARLLDLRLPNGRPLILSFNNLREVEEDDAYVCVTVGRTANRIRGGTFRIGDSNKEVVLECNDGGRNHTHGGQGGWSKKLFAVRERTESAVELFLYSPDKDQGYPSSVEVVIRYELTGQGELAVSLVTTNVGHETTVTNMTLHTYFDLTGQCGRVRGSVLPYKVAAPSCQTYLTLDDHNVPTGDVLPVAGTRFDFTEPRAVSKDRDSFEGYDNYWAATNETHLDAPTRSLVVVTAPSGEYGAEVEMEVLSNQPGFQMFTADGFDGKGPGGFEQHGSLAVEPSGYIDAVNHNNFPTIALEPSQTRRQFIKYRFSTQSE